jgi:hypothetical protein
MRERRFPSPWTVKTIPGRFVVIDGEGRSLAYCYGVEPGPSHAAAGPQQLTIEEARKIAANIAKLPKLIKR